MAVTQENNHQGAETRSYEFIPLNERHGKPKHLFFLWFGENMTVFPVVTGALGITVGLNFWWTVLAVIIGNVFGSLLMAFHSAQGPQLGLPQMIQSRAQFGYFGAVLPLLMVWVSYIVLAASDIVIAGQGFQSVFGMNLTLALVIVTIPMVVLAIYGYNWIHRFLRYSSWVYAAFFIFIVGLICVHGVSPSQLNHGGFTIASFLSAVALFATYQISYAPYVSDYSRYLPPDTANKTFWGTYLGTTLSTVWLMILGAAIAALAPTNSTMAEIQSLGGAGGSVLTILLTLGLIAPNATNVYGGGITALSIASNFVKFRTTVRLRTIVSIAFGVICVLVSSAGSSNFMTNLENYLNMLLYFMIPWTTINLTDFYFIHRGSYNVDDFFKADGPFGRYNWSAIVIYIIGFLIEVPFMNTSIYEGPLAKALGGADISWILGVVVVFPIYYWFAKAAGRRKFNATAVAE